MKELPILQQCFKCGDKVFEFEDNKWGCDCCKAVWTYKGKCWTKSGPQLRKKSKLIITN